MSDADAMREFNRQVMAEFRANAGVVGGRFAGLAMLILHSRGAKSGAAREIPLVYRAHDGQWAIFASKAGAPTHPSWYHNLVVYPEASIEVGAETIHVRARVLGSTERAEVWEAQKRAAPVFANYEAATTRTIPVVLLTRRA